MAQFIVYNENKVILRTGSAPLGMVNMQAGDGEFVIVGTAADKTQKMEFDGLDESGRPINPRLVDKTPEEIERDNPTPPEIPDEDRPAQMTKKDLAKLMKRVDDLENNREIR